MCGQLGHYVIIDHKGERTRRGARVSGGYRVRFCRREIRLYKSGGSSHEHLLQTLALLILSKHRGHSGYEELG